MGVSSSNGVSGTSKTPNASSNQGNDSYVAVKT